MENKSLEESVVAAMDGGDISLLKYLPYILQDFWEIGTSPEGIIKIITKYKTDYSRLNVLDLGCGKGAVCIKIAKELGCKCFGIDAIDEFVKFSNDKAKEFSVDNLCTFETADIRTKIKTLGKYDVIILGAIGNVFGNYFETLSQLKPHLNKDGLIIIDDAFIDDDCEKNYANNTNHTTVLQKSDLLQQITDAKMELVKIITSDEMFGIDEEYKIQFSNIEKRCIELSEKHPEDKKLFLDYIKNQKNEYKILTDEIIPAVFVIKENF